MRTKSFLSLIRTVALMVVTALLLAGCGTADDTEEPDETTQGSDTSTSGAAEAESANPDTLVITVADEPPTLDPAESSESGVGYAAMHQVYNRLVEVPASGGELVPGLASEVPTLENGLISEDGLTYTFPIREGVTFHDGTDLTAEDVQYSWDRVVEMDLPESQSEIFDNVAETQVVDDFTFEVTLDQIDAAFLHFVAADMAASVVSPDAVEANGGITAGQRNEFMATNMVGTGPYVFESWSRGENLEFSVNEEYWGEPAKMPVRWVVLANEPAAGMQAREYDIIDISPDKVPGIEAIEHAVVERDVLGLQLLEIGFNMNIDPEALPPEDTIPPDFFHDRRIRQAFNYAFNYQGYIDGILDGLGSRGSFVLPQGMVGYDPEAPIYETDPEMAEQLFREAGVWEEGFTVSISSDQTHEGFTGAALTLKDSIEALNPNFHVNVLAVPEARHDEMLATQPLPMAMWSYTTSIYTTPDAYFDVSAHTEGRYGAIAGFANGYTDPEMVDSLIEEARTSLDQDRRLEIFTELQQILYEEAMWVMPAQEASPVAYGEWMEGVVVNPMWPRPPYYWPLYSK